MRLAIVITASVLISAVTGCKCVCKCPYCCGGEQVDYNNSTNKPVADMPVWWKQGNN